MTLEDFKASLGSAAPAPGLSAPLAALWHAANDGWQQAHRLVQDEPDADAAWVHAYLHRVEGDMSNAAYWYGRAGKAKATGDLTDERNAIAAALLAPT